LRASSNWRISASTRPTPFRRPDAPARTEHLPVRFQAESELPAPEQQEREVQARLGERWLRRQRTAEGVHRQIVPAGMEVRDTEVVQGQRVDRVERHGALIALQRIGGAS
jgi:hypothetical protein